MVSIKNAIVVACSGFPETQAEKPWVSHFSNYMHPANQFLRKAFNQNCSGWVNQQRISR
jgi:hypothetical protein